MEKPPVYRTGPTKAPPKEVQDPKNTPSAALLRSLDEFIQEGLVTGFPGEFGEVLSGPEQNELEQILEGMISFFKERYSLDLSERLHSFRLRAVDDRQAVAEGIGLSQIRDGLTIYTPRIDGQIVWEKVIHELLHAFSQRTYLIDRSADQGKSLLLRNPEIGFSTRRNVYINGPKELNDKTELKGGRAVFLNEAITQTLTLRVADYLKQKAEGLNYLDGVPIGYPKTMIAMEILMKKLKNLYTPGVVAYSLREIGEQLGELSEDPEETELQKRRLIRRREVLTRLQRERASSFEELLIRTYFLGGRGKVVEILIGLVGYEQAGQIMDLQPLETGDHKNRQSYYSMFGPVAKTIVDNRIKEHSTAVQNGSEFELVGVSFVPGALSEEVRKIDAAQKGNVVPSSETDSTENPLAEEDSWRAPRWRRRNQYERLANYHYLRQRLKMLIGSENLQQAREVYLKLYKMNPEDPEPARQMALCADASSQPELAAECYEHYLATMGDFPDEKEARVEAFRRLTELKNDDAELIDRVYKGT